MASGLSVVSALAASAILAPAEAQDVEIISGLEVPAARVGAAPGVRMMAFVQFEPAATSYRVIRPMLATEILSVQAALALAGHDPGVRDGILGPATSAALTAFQTARALEPCGCVDYETVMALGLERRVVQTVLGSPDDEPSPEIVMPEGRIEPRRAPPAAPPTADTVTVVRGTGPARRGAGLGGVPILGIPVPWLPPAGAAEASAPRGVPFGGSSTRGRSTIRTIPPPRR